MAVKRGGLGRGLDALIPAKNRINVEDISTEKTEKSTKNVEKKKKTTKKSSSKANNVDKKSGKSKKSKQTFEWVSEEAIAAEEAFEEVSPQNEEVSLDNSGYSDEVLENESATEGADESGSELEGKSDGEDFEEGGAEETAESGDDAFDTGEAEAAGDGSYEGESEASGSADEESTEASGSRLEPENDADDEGGIALDAETDSDDGAYSASKSLYRHFDADDDAETDGAVEADVNIAGAEAEGAPTGSAGAYNKESMASSPAAGVDGDEGRVLTVRISQVEPNREQPRKKFRESTIDELAESIRIYGVIQPLLVQDKGDHYEIVAGERRWRAARKAGLKEIPVIVRSYEEQAAQEIALIENIQREDLNPIEEASAYDRLIREFSMTQEELAERVSRSRSAIANSLRLLKLCDDVRDLVIDGALSEGHARALLPLASETEQLAAAEKVVKNKMSVRETEKMVKGILRPAAKKVSNDAGKYESVYNSLADNLKALFGTKVTVKGNGKRGSISFDFYSNEELDRIYSLLASAGRDGE